MVDGKTWGIAFAAVTGINAISLTGMAFLKWLQKKPSWVFAMEFLIAIGSAVLFCDGIMHLLPEGLQLPESENPEHIWHYFSLAANQLNNTVVAWDISLVCLGFYVLWLVDVGCRQMGHGHSHDLNALLGESDNHRDTGHVNHAATVEVYDTIANPATECTGEEGVEEREQESFWKKFTRGAKKVLPIFIGDCMHHLTDGIVLAGTFSTSMATGLGTTIAILLHEIPHELGNYAVYIKLSGDWRVAIILNLISSILADYIGLVIGLGAVSIEGFDSYLVLFTAGAFVYVAIMQILPQLTLNYEEEEVKSHFWWKFFLANLGLIMGWAIMLLIKMYEEDIENWFTDD